MLPGASVEAHSSPFLFLSERGHPARPSAQREPTPNRCFKREAARAAPAGGQDVRAPPSASQLPRSTAKLPSPTEVIEEWHWLFTPSLAVLTASKRANITTQR